MLSFFVPLQVLLESLPISSSSHLTLLGYQPTTALDFFAHGPTALVLLIYFRNDIYTFLSQWRYQLHKSMPYLVKLACAEIPTLLMFLAIKTFKTAIPLWCGLAITGLMLLSLRTCKPVRRGGVLSWNAALAVGIMQGLSLLPGISRLASTLVVARWCGVDQRTAFRFSCALQLPLFAGAALLGIGLMLFSGDPATAYLWSFSSMGLIFLAMIMAYFELKIVERLYCTDELWPVGFYMVIPIFFSFFL